MEEQVVQGKPSAEIMRLAAEKSMDMIVLGTHGKGMLDQALFGSTTERVVAPCSLPGHSAVPSWPCTHFVDDDYGLARSRRHPEQRRTSPRPSPNTGQQHRAPTLEARPHRGQRARGRPS